MSRTIAPDPDRFRLVRKIWDLALQHVPSARILDVVNEEWGFRTRKFRRLGDKPLAHSTLYKLLSNPFYYGLIVRNRQTFAGAHKPMVSRDEFARVQRNLGRPNRQSLKKRFFPFRGLIRCGECGCAVTAEEKINRFGTHYTYYHCTKRRRQVRCTQRVIQVRDLEVQIRDILRRIQAPPRVLEWGSRHLDELRAEETKTRAKKRASVEAALKRCDAQLGRLTDLRLRDLLSDDEYAVKREQLIEEKLRLSRNDGAGRPTTPVWFEPSRHFLSFLIFARKRFDEGTDEDKRAILQTLGSNLTLKDKILRVQLQKPFLWVEEEPSDSTWCGLVDRVRTFFAEHPHTIAWPEFCKAQWSSRSVHQGSRKN